MPSFEQAHAIITGLVKDFAEHESKYLAPGYQEAEVRKDFIDKFLIALGWDVNHDTQKNPYEQEVKVERGQQQGTARKRADYAFSLAPNYRDVRFFAEAKKPSVDIANAQDYFQTLRYGWNSGNPLVVITDFEQFHILDSRYKPNVETALNRLVKDGAFHYRDYLDTEKFSRIYWLFSREAIANGSLEKYAATLPKPRGGSKQLGLFKDGTQKIDESFLEELDEYRLILARTFKKTDASLDGDTLTELVQRTLDRLVFIRFLEDRLIEPDYLVSKFGQKDSAWSDFIATCHRLDGIYNGIVFKKHALLDAAQFAPDGAAFADICERLSHLNSPYDFNAIPIHILGSIYERFLGKVIVATAKQARVEDKPEARETNGVYYTPDYIVRYIVANTVGKLISTKNPDAVAKLRFADIACGSGSFLLGVFEELLEYHTAYYNQHPKRATKNDCYTHEDGSLHLTLKKRREILLNSVYGVDLDPQAVEVAQLSLYLRLLQDETTLSAHQYQTEFHETLLPSLSGNIKRGNSLIDFNVSEDLFETQPEKKLAPMDFASSFPAIMKSGGFDAIVGNPPYVDLKGMPPEQVRYIFTKYSSSNNRINLFATFIERGVELCRQTSFLFSMIVPTSLLTQDSYKALRKLITERYRIIDVVRLPNESFGRAAGEVKVDTVIFVIGSGLGENNQITTISFPGYDRISSIASTDTSVSSVVQQTVWQQHPEFIWSLNVHGGTETILQKCDQYPALENSVEFCLGLTPYDKYKGHTEADIENQKFHADHKKDSTYKKLLSGNDVTRYAISWNGARWISYGPWLGAPREQRFFKQKRILVKQIIDWSSKRIWAALTDEELYNTQNAFNLLAKPGWTLEYVLGILNSRLMTYYHRKKYLDEFKMRFQKLLIKDCRRFPIRPIDFTKSDDAKRHADMLSFAEQMIDAKKKLAVAKTDNDRDYFSSKCESLDRQIDALVYELYGLTAVEVQLIESSL